MYFLFSGYGAHLSSQFIDEALASGEYLEFDQAKNTFKIGKFHEALLSLTDSIYALRQTQAAVGDKRAKFLEMAKSYPSDETPIPVLNHKLVIPFAIQDRETNVLDLTIAILKALDGDNSCLGNLNLRPSSPTEKEAEQIAKETVSSSEAEAWVSSLRKPQ